MIYNNRRFNIKHFLIATILTSVIFIPTIFIAAVRQGQIERSNRIAETEKINAKYAENAKNVEKLLENYLVKNDPNYVYKLCKSTKKEFLQKNILQKCAESHAILVDKSLTENKIGEARVLYNLYLQEYGSNDLLKKYESRLTKAEKIIKEKKIAQEILKEKENKKIEAEIKKQARKEYAKNIRIYYLDSGLDIKVNVSGSNNDKLTMTYVLFNDVWNYQFAKSGNLESMKELGFIKVVMTDGYDYTVYWNL